jgi:hypothetical protein
MKRTNATGDESLGYGLANAGVLRAMPTLAVGMHP